MMIVRPMGIGLAVAAAILCQAADAAAQANDEIFPEFQWTFSTPGARVNGMGRTFIGLADHATATVTNPAGLMNLTRTQVYVEYKNADVKVNRLATAGSSLPGSQNPTPFTTNVNALSFFNVSMPYKKAAVGFTVHQFLNYQEAFQLAPRAVPDINTNQVLSVPAFPVHGNAEFKGMAYVGSVAYPVTNQVWVGLSLSANVLDAKSAATRFGVVLGSAFPADPTALTESSIIVNQTSIDDTSAAIGGNLGVLFRPNEIFWIGFTYTKSPSFSIGERLLRNPGYAGAPCCGTNQTLTPYGDFPDPKTVAINFPDRFGVGLAARPLPKLFVAGDFVRVRYSSLAEGYAIIQDFANPTVTGDKFTRKDVTEGHFGAEYNVLSLNHPLFVRAGVFTNPTHTERFTPTVNDNTLNSYYNAVYNLLPQTREPKGTLGAGVAVGLRFQVDVAHVWKNEFIASATVRF